MQEYSGTILHLEDEGYIRRLFELQVATPLGMHYVGTGVPNEFLELVGKPRSGPVVYVLDNNVKPYGPQLVTMVAKLRQAGVRDSQILGLTGDTLSIAALVAPVKLIQKPADSRVLREEIKRASLEANLEPDNLPQ